MGLSRTVAEISVEYRKIFPIPRVFNAAGEGFPLEFCNGGLDIQSVI